MPIDLLMVLQRETVLGEIEAVDTVRDVFPVDQILGVKDDQPRHTVHGGAGEVVIVAYAEDVGVAELVVEQWVGKGAVAVVGSP